jgi:hypothetical protein
LSNRLANSLAVLLVASGCSRADFVKDGVATDEGIAAIALPEAQYRDMLKRSALGTMSGPMFLAKLGVDDGCDLLDDAVDKEVDKNLPTWRANLIAAYRDNVPAKQLAEAVQRSPRRARTMLEPYRPAIGSAMKSSSEPLLKSSSVEVLKAMGDVALTVDSTSTDTQARMRYLAHIKASREICGVGGWQPQ